MALQPLGGTITSADYSGGIDPAGLNPCNVAADSGSVYAAGWPGGSPVKVFDASEFATGTPPHPSGTQIDATATALAVDPTSGELYVDEGDQIRVFGSSGVSQYTFGSAEDFGTNSSGVAVEGENGKAYVADRTAGQVDVYTPYLSALPPVAATGAATGVGFTVATLHGKVNPRSSAISDCHFDYVDDAAFKANGFTGAQSAPCVPDPGSGSQAVDVTAGLSNLSTGTTYHFRISATNEGGTANGRAASFSTPTVAVTDPATGTDHHTDATLHGHIEPHGETITNCQFDWGSTTAYGNTLDCAEGDSFTEPTAVSAFINGLTPGEAVHYRLHLTTAAQGEALGGDRVFAPTPAVVHPLTATIGSAGSGANQLSLKASEVAVDQSSGNFYVADTGNDRVLKYDADGNFLSAWGWGVSDGSNAYQVCTSSCRAGIPVEPPESLTVDQSNGDLYVFETVYPGKIVRYDAAGNPKDFTAGPAAGTNKLALPGYSAGPSETEVAVDSSGGPTDGDIYVTVRNSSSEWAIAVFANDGTPLGDITGADTPNGSFSKACGVAVNQSNGDLYVGDSAGVWRYSPSGGTITSADYSGGIDPAGLNPCNVAADSGNVYAAGSPSGSPVKRFAASEFATGTPPTPAGTQIDATATALAVDSTSGELYVDEGDKVQVFDASGVSQYSFGSADDFGTNSTGVAIEGENGKAYVADRSSGQVDVYTPSPRSLDSSVGRFPIGPPPPGQFDTPQSITVDNSGGPSDGDVYVSAFPFTSTQVENGNITKLNAAGNVISSWGSGGQVNSVKYPRSLAVDSTGRLGVLDYGGSDALQFFDGSTGAPVETISGLAGGGRSFAVEPGGTYLLSDGGAVRRFDPSLPHQQNSNFFFVSKRGASGENLALDPGRNELYTAPRTRIGLYRFDASGNVIQPDRSICVPGTAGSFDVGSEGCNPTETFGEGDLTRAEGIGVNDTTRRVYVIDSGQLKIFSTFNVTSPTVTVGDVSELAGTTATLSAKVDPERSRSPTATSPTLMTKNSKRTASPTPPRRLVLRIRARARVTSRSPPNSPTSLRAPSTTSASRPKTPNRKAPRRALRARSPRAGR